MAGACNFCCRIVKLTPVIFISAIIVWSYYAYVVEMCFVAVPNDSIAEKVIYLFVYHPLLVMFVWSYIRTIFQPTGRVPRQFFLSKQEADRLEKETNEDVQKSILINFAKNLPIQNTTNLKFPRYCEKCRCIKPDRSHHCSVCGYCILKMDHHCPWVNSCVGFTSYKFFILFLGYGVLYCLYITATTLKYFIQFWSGAEDIGMGKFHILFLFFIAIMFGVSLISLFGYHLYLTFHNRSTLESFRAPIFQSGPDQDGFSLGSCNNFMAVFGENKLKWFLPVFTSQGDGVSFPTKSAPASSYQTMGITPSVGDGVTYPTRTIDLDSDDLLGDRQRWMEDGDISGNGNMFNNKAFEHHDR